MKKFCITIRLVGNYGAIHGPDQISSPGTDLSIVKFLCFVTSKSNPQDLMSYFRPKNDHHRAMICSVVPFSDVFLLQYTPSSLSSVSMHHGIEWICILQIIYFIGCCSGRWSILNRSIANTVKDEGKKFTVRVTVECFKVIVLIRGGGGILMWGTHFKPIS